MPNLRRALQTHPCVLLLKGRYPQTHMAGMTGLELCLYDGRSRKARVADADRLINPPASKAQTP